MSNYWIALAIASAMSAPAVAQTTQSAPTTDQAQQAKPQTVKKRICEDTSDNPYSRISNRSCRTIEDPVKPTPSGGTSAGPNATSAQPNPRD